MNKNTENGIDTEEIDEIEVIEVEEKTLIFNPVGFILKMIVSIIFVVLFVRSEFSGGDWLYLIVGALGNFGAIYMVASFFGLLVNLTGNYLVALIMFIASIFGYQKLFNFIEEKGLVAQILFNTVMVIIMVVIIVRDIRKAALYFKHTL